MITYLELLRLLFPTKEKIWVTEDKASMHMCDVVLERIAQTNQTIKPQIIDKFIEAGMTSTYQPPDVVINKLLKDVIKHQYNSFK
jgi:hypothetical protein